VKDSVSEEQSKLLIAVRLRGESTGKPDVRDTLTSLRLEKKHHASIYYNQPQVNGMLRKAKDVLTWGEVKSETMRRILEKKAEVKTGKKSINELPKELGFSSMDELTKAMTKGDVLPEKLWRSGVKPVFRLHPPKGGFKGTIRRPYKSGGELGYRGAAINDLILRMT
jgi:large subunit ribosomal protein L30